MTFERHNTRKRFGQHWLKDNETLENIILAANLSHRDRVLEVGPGRGALTSKLLDSSISVVHGIEVDRDLYKGLKQLFRNESRFTIDQGDVLSMPLMHPDGLPLNKVVANIPYNITGPLLKRFLGELDSPVDHIYERLVLLLQKEVADRILASQGDKNFNAFSVRMQLMSKCSLVCEVSKNCFQPPPKVDSAVIAIEPFTKENLLKPEIALWVNQLLIKAFSSRRKKLRNTIGICNKSDLVENILRAAGISINQRPQEVSPFAWVKIARGFYELENKSLC